MRDYRTRWTAGLAGVAAAIALIGAASAQDDADDAVDADAAEVDAADADAERAAQLESDVSFMRDCLNTLSARGAPARVCLGVVSRACAGEPDAETTTGAAACEAREGEVWQTLLDEAASEAEDDLPNAERAVFSSAQDAWILYRDAECSYEAALLTGDAGAEAERTACVNRLTAERTISLRARKSDADRRGGGR